MTATVARASDWEPGDPLYPHPSQRECGDGNYLRHLFDVVCDEEVAVAMMITPTVHFEAVCTHCLVGWAASDGPNCWMCDKPAGNYHVALEYEQTLRTRCADTAYLCGGPGDGLRMDADMNMPEDTDHVWVRVTADDRPRQVLDRRREPAAEGLHRYVRTDEWRNRSRAYVFRYEGEVGEDGELRA